MKKKLLEAPLPLERINKVSVREQSIRQPASQWLPTALGLLVTGIVAQGYALYCSVKQVRELNS